MRQRITYIRNYGDDFSPKQLIVSKNSMVVENLVAAKEHRFTIGFSELPQELTTVLEQCHELHIRWASEKPYTVIEPFVSRVAPGLHVFFTPEKETSSDLLCTMLKRIFSADIKCSTPAATFSNPSLLSTRFASSASSQYHTPLPSLSNLVQYLQRHLQHAHLSDNKTPVASSLLSADYLDIDYDAISHALLVTPFWGENPEGGGWHERILGTGGDRIEVGILNGEKADEVEEMAMGGWLTVVGENEKPNPTLFSFPSRHHPLPQSTRSAFYTTFDQPTGLHPTLRITIPPPQQSSNNALLTPPLQSCGLHAYLTIPSALFLDRYAFTDPLSLSSHNLVALRSLSGATDLEAPDWAIPQWGSASLFELSTLDSSSETEVYTATIPLHTRYLTPSTSASNVNTSAPYPALFWACPVAEGAPGSAKMSVNPFDRTNLGYDGLFGDRTVFYHFTPAVAPPQAASGHAGAGVGILTTTLSIPTIDLRQAAQVESGTVTAIVLGTLWILWKLFGPLGNSGGGVGAGGGHETPQTDETTVNDKDVDNRLDVARKEGARARKGQKQI